MRALSPQGNHEVDTVIAADITVAIEVVSDPFGTGAPQARSNLLAPGENLG